jgi:5-methyltetrahydrofolate--homocysteine methyltransferase
MRQNILDVVKTEVLLADGAIGTELFRLGLEAGGFGELWNVERPEAVRSVYEAYREAGARLFTTNSFRANRHSLASHHFEDRVIELNRQAAQIARDAAAGRAWVLGSIGPFGGFLEPLGQTTRDEALSFFTAQAGALLEGGADGIVIETMTAAEEVEIAIRAARTAGAGVIIAMMTFGRAKGSFRTMMGVSPQQAVKTMEEAGADIVGSNCGDGLSMEDYVDLTRIIRSSTEKPVIIRPNAGQPDLLDSGVQYRQTPELMARQVKELVRAGANIIGGCCGTTPEHIRLFGKAIQQ